MTKPYVNLVIVCAAILAASSNAAVIRVDVSLDLTSGTIRDESGLFGQPPTQVWFADSLAIAPVALSPGDILRIDVQFAGGLALEMTSGEWGRQRLWATQPNSPGCTGCSLTTTLTDIALAEGQVSVPVATQTDYTGFGGSGSLLANLDSPLTDTMIALTGFTLVTEYGPNTTPPVFDEIRFMFQADELAIVPVPLPAALWLMSLAVGALVAPRVISR